MIEDRKIGEQVKALATENDMEALHSHCSQAFDAIKTSHPSYMKLMTTVRKSVKLCLTSDEELQNATEDLVILSRILTIVAESVFQFISPKVINMAASLCDWQSAKKMFMLQQSKEVRGSSRPQQTRLCVTHRVSHRLTDSQCTLLFTVSSQSQ